MNKNIVRLSWLDYGKAISMLITILFHTEIMYTGETSLFTDLVFFNTSMVFFFFVSGYLTNLKSFDIKKALTSLFKRLLIPYFIFTTIIYIPKHLVRGWDLDISTMFIDIFGGVASWFIAALVVSKLLISIILKFTRNIYIIGFICFLFVITGFFLTHYFQAPLYWYINYAFISMFYLFLGILYRKFENKLSINLVLQAIISSILFFALAYCDFKIELSSYIYGLKQADVEALGVITYLFLSIIGIWMIVSLMKLIPIGIKWLSYVGINSLTYYYLNTGLLLVIITIINKLGFTETNIWFTFPLYATVIILLTFASELIIRFAPWMVGNFGNKKNNNS